MSRATGPTESAEETGRQEETPYMLNHSHRVCQEVQAPLKALKRRGDRQQHEMKEQLELQRAELQQLSTELEKAHAAAAEGGVESPLAIQLLCLLLRENSASVEKYEPCSTHRTRV